MVGVILAAGDGTRLKSSSNENRCKPLTEANGKTLIEYALDNLLALEIFKAYIVIGKEGDLIKQAIGNEYKNIKIHYVCQQEQKGLMNAFLQALNVMECNETVVLQLSDEIFIDLETAAIKTALSVENVDFYCGVAFEENPEKIKNNFSVETDSDSSLIKCIEKPQTVINNVKGTGFTVFNNKTQKVIKDTYNSNPEKIYDLCDCFNYLVLSGYCGKALNIAKKEFNINTISELTEAESFLK